MEHQRLDSRQGLISKVDGGGTRSVFGALLSLAFIGALPACAPLSSKPPESTPPPVEKQGRGAPDWAGMPLGWDKLIEIERWLRSDAQRFDPFWRVQGELILGEGRVSLANQDVASSGIDAEKLRERLALAREGFQRVLSEGAANAAQRARAERGLAEIGELAGAPPPPESALAIVPRSSWKAQSPVTSRLDPVGGTWTRVTVHHSDAVPGTRLDGGLADTLEAVRKIQRNHVENRGWGDVGYHYFVDAAGRIVEGRSLQWQGAHAGGENNVKNLGLCLLGDFQRRSPTDAALESLQELLDELCQRFDIQRQDVMCHRDLMNTVCPGDPVASWVRAYERGSAPHAGGSSAPRAATPVSAAPKPAAVASASSRRGGGKVR